jgi:hypothetical protein
MLFGTGGTVLVGSIDLLGPTNQPKLINKYLRAAKTIVHCTEKKITVN